MADEELPASFIQCATDEFCHITFDIDAIKVKYLSAKECLRPGFDVTAGCIETREAIASVLNGLTDMVRFHNVFQPDESFRSIVSVVNLATFTIANTICCEAIASRKTPRDPEIPC